MPARRGASLDQAAGLTLVGVRSMTGEEATCSPGNTASRSSPVARSRSADVDGIVATLGPDVYVSFDLDAFDPSFMAAVGTPEPGGMGWWEALGILCAVGERRRIVGFDVVELAPDEGPEACAYTAAEAGVQAVRIRDTPLGMTIRGEVRAFAGTTSCTGCNGRAYAERRRDERSVNG